MVDTSAVYALLDRSDTHHRKAVALLKKLRKEDCMVSLTNFIIAEAYALILAKLGHSLARLWLKGLRWPIQRVSEEDEERAREILYIYEDKAFSYTDATTFAVMERGEIKRALAFDKHFQQFGFVLFE